MSIYKGVDDDVVHTTMEYYSGIKRNETGSFVERGMNIEAVI